MRGDFRREFGDEAVVVFVHGGTKLATSDVYLVNHTFEFLYFLFEFYVLRTSNARLAVQDDASFRPENLRAASTAQTCHSDLAVDLR